MSDCTSEKHCDHGPKPGSRSWWWNMRLKHSTFWFSPSFGLLVAWYHFDQPGSVHHTMLARLVHSVPWVVVAVVLAGLARALWRIEVNMAAWEKPFTKRDAEVLKKASQLLLAVDGVLLVGGLIVLPFTLLLLDVPLSERRDLNYVNAVWGPLMVITALLMVTESTRRFYGKAKTAYAELEKGV